LPHPEVRDLWSYEETGFHHLLVASVEERFEKEAMRTAFGLLGQGQLGLTKVLVTVGPNVNPRRLEEVFEAIAEHFDPSEDFHLLTRVPFDTLDFTSMTLNLGSKMILDATPKSPSAGRGRPDSNAKTPGGAIPDLSTIDRRIVGQARLGRPILVIQVEADPKGALEAALAALRDTGEQPKIVAAVSTDIPLENSTLLLWGIFTRFDPARDIFFEESKLRGAWPVHRGRMAIDATFKDGYPAPLEMDPDIVRKVDRRWKEYGIDSSAS
jgi:4-hydroxy-3-polyprenylbenzoate decarboxylase